MNNMFLKTPVDGYWLNEDSIKKVEKIRNATYMGYWCTKRLDGETWNEKPVDVFYQPNPDTEKGHSNYFGLLFKNGNLFITDAATAFVEPLVGIKTDDGEVIVSRYRHDCVNKGEHMIDGGRDYIRTNGSPTISITVVGSNFVFEDK